MIYLKLFITFFKIGLFNFGGGYAMITFIESEVVRKQAWLSTAEFTDVVAVSQMTPGPIGINMATYTGFMASGDVWGSVIATGAVCLPSFILMILISKYFLKYQQNKGVQDAFKGLRPAVVGLIAAAALVLMNHENFVDVYSYIIFALAFILTYRYRLHPIKLIVLAGLAGLVLY